MYWIVGGTFIKSNRLVYAPSFSTIRASAFIEKQSGWQCSQDFQEQDGRGDGSVRAMRHEFPCDDITNLRVSCYNGINDRSAWVLFVQHPREQDEWSGQNPRYARVLTASLCPSHIYYHVLVATSCYVAKRGTTWLRRSCNVRQRSLSVIKRGRT